MAEVAKGVMDKAMSGVRERLESGKALIRNEIGVGKGFISDVTQLRPVEAVVDLVADTVDNTGDFVKKQAEITRRWLGGLR
jgi:hypothetical protein